MNEAYFDNDTGNKRPIQTETFDYKSLDDANGWQEPDGSPFEPMDSEPTEQRTTDRSEIVREILDVIHPQGKKISKTTIQGAGLRVMLLRELVQPSGESLAKIASALGMSRAALSWHLCKLSDQTGLRHRTQKRPAFRGIMSEATRAAWSKRKQGGDT